MTRPPVNTIHHGDCLAWMRTLDDACVDLVLTSPPYNLGVSSGGGIRSSMRSGKWAGAALSWGYEEHDDQMDPAAYIAWQQDVLRECWRILSPAGAIYYNHKPRVQNGELWLPLECNPGLPLRQIVIWARAGGLNFNEQYYVPAHEWIMILAKPGFRLADSGASDVWRIPQEARTDHPAPFPLALARRVVESTTAAVICDPFAGSGTTLVAAKEAGRQYVGCDISASYVSLAEKRLARVQPRLFGKDASAGAVQQALIEAPA